MSTDGQLGECPEWWPLLSAARYLGVAPWDLAARPLAWQHIAHAAMRAEETARRNLSKK